MGGGTERIARRLGQAWRAEGRCVTLLIGDPDGVVEWLGDDPPPVRVPESPIRRRLGSRRALGRWAGQVALAGGMDALYIPGNAHLPIVPALAGTIGKADVAVVAALSNPIRRADRSTPRQWLFERVLSRRLASLSAVTAPSIGIAREAERLVPAERLHVVAIPSLDNDVRPAPPPHPEAPPVIVAVGRLVAQKNWPLLLDALARTPPEVRLILVGQGPDEAALKARADGLGLADRVRFTGHLPDIAGPLREARLLVISSDYESGPAVLVEALAAGRPVVSTQCAPGMKESLPASHVDLVPTRDAGALAAAIVRRLALPPTPVPEAALAPYRIGPVARRYLELMDEAS